MSLFCRYGARWESSFLCRLSGFLCVFASQTGLFLLTIAALERCLAAAARRHNKTDGHNGEKHEHTNTHTHLEGIPQVMSDLLSLQVAPRRRSPSVWPSVCVSCWAWPSHCPPCWPDTVVPPSACRCLPPPPHPPLPSPSLWCSSTPCVSSS